MSNQMKNDMKQLIILLTTLLTLNVNAKYVNGTVYDENGQTLTGVNVVIKGIFVPASSWAITVQPQM